MKTFSEHYAQSMSLEEFKKAVEKNLTTIVGKEKVHYYMNSYANDFQDIYDENWTVEGITPAMLMNLY